MKVYRLLFYFFLLNCIPLARAGTINISGTGNGYAGVELKLFFQTDPVSKRLKPLFRVRCDSTGSFSCEIPSSGDGKLYIKAGIYSFFLYTREGSEYVLRLPEFYEKTEGEKHNPFFVETSIIPQVINNQKDINNFIRIFDTEFNPVYNDVADRIFKNYGKSDIPGLIQKLNSLSGIDTSSFFLDFVKFRMIMLNRVAQGEYPGRMEDSLMINLKFLPRNPAYIDLINQQFTGYFRAIQNGPFKEEYLRAIATSSVVGLKDILRKDGKAENISLQEYVIMLDIYSEYYYGTIPPGNALAILSELKMSGSVVFIRGTAAILLERMNSLRAGTLPPDFSLLDEYGKPVTPADFKGKYLLITFARSDNPYTVEEYHLLTMWFGKYSNDLQIITILTDSNFHSALEKMKKQGFSWKMLDGSRADMLEYTYDIKMYPSFMLIDREGKIAIPDCPFPSEYLESIIKRLVNGSGS
jgi:peroxiredoxin